MPRKTNNLIQLREIALVAGHETSSLELALTHSRNSRRLAETKLSKVSSRSLAKFLKEHRGSEHAAAIEAELADLFGFAMSQKLISKNPLLTKVGEVQHRIKRALQVLAAAAVVLIGSFAIQVQQRAQQTQEDPILATADVARDLGMGQLVATLENYYYGQLNPAKVGGKPSEPVTVKSLVGTETENGLGSQSPATSTAVANIKAWGGALAPSQIPARVISPASPALPGEGQWLPTKLVVNGHVAARVARVRPDSVHTSFLDSLIWFDPHLLAFQEVPGTLEPKGNFARGNGKVAKSLAPFYMAGINGGYKTDNMHGGFFYRGKQVIAMRDGAATFLTYPDGSFDIVSWGHETARPGFTAARQNLTLLVDQGKNIVKNDAVAKWGSAAQGVSSGHIFVWRSAIGVRADGTVVHLVGPSLSTSSMADLLVRAGVVRGMALDMNNGWASSYFYGPYGAGAPMDPKITHVVSRFKDSSTRDFIAVFAKSGATASSK